MGCAGSTAKRVSPEESPEEKRARFTQRRLSIPEFKNASDRDKEGGSSGMPEPPPVRNSRKGMHRLASFRSPQIDEDHPRSLEINPFPTALVGTFTNHGVKPDFTKPDDLASVPINQDRGLISYPVADDTRQVSHAHSSPPHIIALTTVPVSCPGTSMARARTRRHCCRFSTATGALARASPSTSRSIFLVRSLAPLQARHSLSSASCVPCRRRRFARSRQGAAGQHQRG